jgi:hypothetical protein
MVQRSNDAKKLPYDQNLNKSGPDQLEYTMDTDVKKALDNYQCSINRYDNADLSDPRIENVYFLERQIAYIGLQLALAKTKIRKGMDPTLDYTSFENLMKFVGQSGK